MCSPVGTPVLVQSQGNLPQCDSQQTVQTPAGHSDGIVPAPGGLYSDLSQVAPSEIGLVRDQVQAASVRVPSPRRESLGSGYSEPVLGESGPVCIPPIPLTNVVTKALGHQCQSMILMAPGWPNMPWFWDLVELSSQILLRLPNWPNLLAQLFNGSLYMDLQNLNLHAWLLEPMLFGNRVCLTRWQQELKQLRDGLPDLSMKQSDPFLFDAARQIRWTSIRCTSPSVEQIADFLLHLFQDKITT